MRAISSRKLLLAAAMVGAGSFLSVASWSPPAKAKANSPPPALRATGKNYLGPGETLVEGTALQSASGKYFATAKHGNFVVYYSADGSLPRAQNPGITKPLDLPISWQTNLPYHQVVPGIMRHYNGNSGSNEWRDCDASTTTFVRVESTGELVVYEVSMNASADPEQLDACRAKDSPQSKILWQKGSFKKGFMGTKAIQDRYLLLQDDGNLVLYNGSSPQKPGLMDWSSFQEGGKSIGPASAPPAPPPAPAAPPAAAPPAPALEVLDVAFYLAKYPDVRALTNGNQEEAKKHWINKGMLECRQSSRTFSVADYVNRHRDLMDALGKSTEVCLGAVGHWLSFGKREGRNAAPEKP